MSNQENTWVKFEKKDATTGRFIMAPLPRGMGVTLGNALRRILLSGLRGAGITSIVIEGVAHEFETFPHLVEDVLDIICNLKGVTFKLHTDGPKQLLLKAKGAGKIYAKDIKTDAEVDIINGDHYIAEITKSGKLNIEITLEKKVGYLPSEAHKKDEDSINTIYLDTPFSPIVRVNYDVENVRVGQELNHDQLIVDIITNGSIDTEEAVKEAVSILVGYFSYFGDLNKVPEVAAVVIEEPSTTEQKKQSALSISVDDLELSARSLNCLKKAGVLTVSDLMQKDLSELGQIKNFGRKSADEINSKLQQYGLELKKGSLA